jgi:hypothetical protein
MIAWMSEETSRIIYDNHLEVYGFNNDDEAEACMSVCKDDIWYTLELGDVRGLSADEIDRRFRNALLKTEGLVVDLEAEDWKVIRKVA